MTVEQSAMPYGWSPNGVPLDRPDGSVLFEGGQPEGAPAFWDTVGIPYRPNLVPDKCQVRMGNGLQCGGYRIHGGDLCAGHQRAADAEKRTALNEG